MSDEHVGVRQLINNMVRLAALPFKEHPDPFLRQLRPLDDEKPSAHRKRIRELVGQRWGYSAATIRAFEGSNGGTVNRFPTLESNEAFFSDMQKYGRLQFDASGKVKRGTLGSGPDAISFLRSVPRARSRVT